MRLCFFIAPQGRKRAFPLWLENEREGDDCGYTSG